MKFTTAAFALALTSMTTEALEHIPQLLENIEDPHVRRRLSTRPFHMLHKAEFHMAANKSPYKQTYEQDLSKLSMGNRFIECNDKTGKAKGKLDCSKMDIESYVYNVELGCNSDDLIGFTYINDLWGWNDPLDGKEYAIVGMFDGTSIVDITDERKPIVLGFIDTSGDLPAGDFSGFWRDIKVVNNVAYIGAEVAEHGVQVFDLTRLRDLERPDVFNNGNGKAIGKTPIKSEVRRIEPDLVIDSIGSSHNIVQFPEMDKVLVVGLSDDSTACDITARESVAVFDVTNPLEPLLETCLSGDYNVCGPGDNCSYDGYVHDGQCVIYHGPDEEFQGLPICVFFVETEVVLFDMSAYTPISKFEWADAAYVHQGWFSEDHTTLYGNDELDELFDTTENGQFPRTRVIDLTDLDNPSPPIALFDNTAVHPSIDHNLYVTGDYIYSANYEAGSRIYKIQEDKSLEEVAFFDISNACDDVDNCVDPFGGSWTHFPYFASGFSIGCSGYEGFYIFNPRV